ncbi:MAG TPA: hypothetical protein VFE51_21245 [Verrucomicrobiae bacterium]|nr:hypothetical protein [Verrucomicrobiae bacterium]
MWQREFQRRFGNVAAPFIERGLHRASWILPRIVASCYPYSAFPMTRGWAEKQRLGDLPGYARAEGSDLAQFASFDEEAQMLIEGGETAKVRPAENSRWFAQAAAEVAADIAEAERQIGSHRNKEFDSTVTDLKILANLALFHSRRIPAAVNYRLFERTKDPHALAVAIADEQNAVDAWRQMVVAAGDFYADDLMMGVRSADLCGHWRDELAALEKDVARLQQQQSDLVPRAAARPAPLFKASPGNTNLFSIQVTHQPVLSAPVDQPLTVVAEVRAATGVKWVRLRYRSVNQREDYKMVPMIPTGQGDQYKGVIPAQDIRHTWDLMYFIEVLDQQGNGRIHPDLNAETPYIVVRLQR